MRIGIISEGVEDQGVIKNILSAVAKSKNIELDFVPMRPKLSKDEYDLNNPQNVTIGTFQGVKNACISKADYDRFFLIEDSNYMIVHLDTAEIDQNALSFERPNKNKNPNYATELRNLMITEINNWLENENFQSKTLYAIAIEEIEAWCLTIFENGDTTAALDPKTKLSKHLAKEDLTYKKLKLNPDKDQSLYFETFTKKKDFHKLKTLTIYAKKNQSLDDFLAEILNVF